ncbi:family 5 carbohydrate esterase [Melampsora larici-populina 98AG31]|uniref:Family 5 carbohydrate esterase n=1 Tax=Melampsora larici-populina (strain 98AG31 / pathotype 3-4-7) TaxID=747676 RepID=F4REH4_MELLP|nr:family 5 carbohydrate esterase [Melampsora larici-populina 98AG31]EGG09270.1 family 5 carbohydrate esterase [Melampsora larici-populina 98AG31]
MSSIRWTLLFLCLLFKLSTISSASTSKLSQRDLRPRMMGRGLGDASEKGADDAARLPNMASGSFRSSGGGASSPSSDAMSGGECGKYTIVSARGTSEEQENPKGYAGFIKGLMKQVPGGANYEVVYPATTDYLHGPQQGATDAMEYIQEQMSKCPSQELVLLGYSEGAMVIIQLLALQDFPAESVSSIIMYGNPYWQAGKSWNYGTAKSGKGIASATGIKLPPAFGPITQDICLDGDIVCTSSGGMKVHFKYPGSQYEKDAVAFSADMFGEGDPPTPDASDGGGVGPREGVGECW